MKTNPSIIRAAALRAKSDTLSATVAALEKKERSLLAKLEAQDDRIRDKLAALGMAWPENPSTADIQVAKDFLDSYQVEIERQAKALVARLGF